MSMGLRMLIGAVIGGGLGWAVYRFIGCSTGACPITSNPYVSIILFAVVGLLLARP
ncbi:MAG: DUF6132 family protein [Kiritimatiellae bacterium]|nr:DUF6132 family protein [Kiritimatiellia bacterium]MDD4736232.1 DUF6132 family protein [Kiritimatiellia bacterium]